MRALFWLRQLQDRCGLVTAEEQIALRERCDVLRAILAQMRALFGLRHLEDRRGQVTTTLNYFADCLHNDDPLKHQIDEALATR